MPTLRRMLKGNGTSWSRTLPATGGKRLQVSKEVADVLDLRMLVGRVGKRRKIMRARRRGALHHGGDEIGLAPSADAVIRIGRDVRHIERAERRRDREPAAELGAIGLIGHGVAGGTSAGIERCRGRWRDLADRLAARRRDDRRDRQPPENAEPGNAGQDGQKENSSQHSPIRHRCRNMSASMTALSA